MGVTWKGFKICHQFPRHYKIIIYHNYDYDHHNYDDMRFPEFLNLYSRKKIIDHSKESLRNR